MLPRSSESIFNRMRYILEVYAAFIRIDWFILKQYYFACFLDKYLQTLSGIGCLEHDIRPKQTYIINRMSDPNIQLWPLCSHKYAVQ